ncbi:serine/threonine-protein phosphatase 2A 55 kDa regulatory subunit B delta isoform [Bos taurus]|uniref:serine/threonine-protein phosphatase 2A 55 kDa regulatory subunit B delta isoform n=1 Tax=Bos taurus TaxID=9913 RepID=UPI0028CB9005|nr:serine/threonine-protein phosphatase 2A 55 kDa regulatory subunit B delta isoform [Bos taurus]
MDDCEIHLESGCCGLSCVMSEGGLCRAEVGGELLHPGPAGQGEGFLVTYMSSSFTQRHPDGPYNNSFWMFDRSTQRIEMLEASRVNSRPRASLQPRRV